MRQKYIKTHKILFIAVDNDNFITFKKMLNNSAHTYSGEGLDVLRSRRKRGFQLLYSTSLGARN